MVRSQPCTAFVAPSTSTSRLELSSPYLFFVLCISWSVISFFSAVTKMTAHKFVITNSPLLETHRFSLAVNSLDLGWDLGFLVFLAGYTRMGCDTEAHSVFDWTKSSQSPPFRHNTEVLSLSPRNLAACLSEAMNRLLLSSTFIDDPRSNPLLTRWQRTSTDVRYSLYPSLFSFLLLICFGCRSKPISDLSLTDPFSFPSPCRSSWTTLQSLSWPIGETQKMNRRTVDDSAWLWSEPNCFRINCQTSKLQTSRNIEPR